MRNFIFIFILMSSFIGNSFGQNNSMDPFEFTTAEEYVSTGANRSTCNYLVFKDYEPWGYPSVTEVLTANGQNFTVANSSQMATIDFSSFDVIVIVSSQDASNFYTNFQANMSKFEAYINAGGIFEAHACTQGTSIILPGGVTTVINTDSYNNVTIPSHPIVAGVSNPFYGSAASHSYFINTIPDTDIITTSQQNGFPTTIEYNMGTGIVTATCCTYEFGYEYGQEAGIMLVNNLNYSCGANVPPSVPISDWAIYFAVLLIGLAIFFRFKTRIA